VAVSGPSAARFLDSIKRLLPTQSRHWRAEQITQCSSTAVIVLVCASNGGKIGRRSVERKKSAITLFGSLTLLICVTSACADDTEHSYVNTDGRHGYILKSGEGEDTTGDGSSIIKASPRTGTQGVVFVVGQDAPSSTSGIHVHLEADEFFYVLNGTGRILLGTEEHEIGAGDTIFVPVGSEHRVTSSEDDPLYVIFIVDRPGLDEQFRLALDRTKMTLEEFNAIVEKYGTVYKTFD